MHKKWQKILDDFEQAEKEMQKNETLQDPQKMQKIGKEIADNTEIVECIKSFQKNEQEITQNTSLLQEAEWKEIASEEIDQLKQENEKLTKKINKLLYKEDPLFKKNAIVEIRSGTGGEEAALFAGDLLRMLLRFCEHKKFSIEIFNKNETENGGLKEICFLVKGKGAFGTLRFESGVHRVQRIPKTESKGRLHTSAASIFVTPEVSESEFQLNEEELKIETFRSSGPGGQSVNTTDSAVRITHLPSGVSVSCQDEKSQHKNKARAMSILRSRLAEDQQRKQQAEQNLSRKEKIGTGDRSEKIRTWNFPQDRVTDHRIKESFFGLKKFLEGNLDDIFKALQEKMSRGEEE